MKWLHGDLHTHTTFSDGKHTIEEAVEIAMNEGMDFIAVTDHNTFSQNDVQIELENFTIVPGVELTTPKGHCNLLGIKKPFEVRDFTEKEEVKNALSAGRVAKAFISINHPFIGDKWAWGFDDMEFDAIELWNGSPLSRNEEAIAWWQKQLCNGMRITATGGSDVHKHGENGRYYGQGHTLVSCENNTQEEIYESLRAGRVCIASSNSASNVFFRIKDTEIGGRFNPLERDELEDLRQVELKMTFKLRQDSVLKIIGDQGVIEERLLQKNTMVWSHVVPTKSKFYRLELWHKDETHQLIEPFFTNPIYICY